MILLKNAIQEFHFQNIHLYQMDCMDAMEQMTDKSFSLCITDPPYGDSCSLIGGSAITGKNGWSGMVKKAGDWNVPPDAQYFNELFRIGKNQIIWGANHFIDLIPFKFSCFLIWDKGQRDFSLADCEMAWTSFKQAARVFDYSRALALQDGKIHPTQKPVKLYEWLLTNYANPGDTILDTHGGSFSSAIAAYRLGFDFTGIELDADYFNAAVKRFKEQTAQMNMFKEVKTDNSIQTTLL